MLRLSNAMAASWRVFVWTKRGATKNALRIASTNFATANHQPTFDKLRAILEVYRKANYSQEVPSRFAKEIVKAADKDGDGVITVDEIEQLLKNIGASDKLSRNEIDHIMEELGASNNKSVPTNEVLSIFKGTRN